MVIVVRITMGEWVMERTNSPLSVTMVEKERRPRSSTSSSSPLGFKAYLFIAYLATAAQDAFAGKLFSKTSHQRWLLLNPCCHGYCFGFVRPHNRLLDRGSNRTEIIKRKNGNENIDCQSCTKTLRNCCLRTLLLNLFGHQTPFNSSS